MTVSQSNVSSIRSIAQLKAMTLCSLMAVFRDYDIRGLAGSELNSEFALRLGKALGQLILYSEPKRVYVARDGRLSSDAASRARCAPVCASQAAMLSTWGKLPLRY